jgi:hypothetical protein
MIGVDPAAAVCSCDDHEAYRRDGLVLPLAPCATRTEAFLEFMTYGEERPDVG